MRDGHTHQYIVGVDEAGRGPIAGPVTVAAVALLNPFDPAVLDGVNDSKKLTPRKRAHFRGVIDELSDAGAMRTAVYSSPASVIDEQGIVVAIRSALDAALKNLSLDPAECHVLLDGSLKAPDAYCRQETIIKGDEKELSIMLAGILAKTERDREMDALSSTFPAYSFETHKGYGTKAHYQAIAEHGMCRIHRASFIHID